LEDARYFVEGTCVCKESEEYEREEEKRTGECV
jgi:hypothetical protein